MALAGPGGDGVGERRFHFQFSSGGTSYELSVPLRLPFRGEARELAVRLIRCHNLPCYLEEELAGQLWEFIREQTLAASDACAEEALDRAFKSEQVRS